MIRYSCFQFIPDLKEMWTRCFPSDSDEFITFYFDHVYRDDQTLVFIESDILVASLQMIPYQIKTGQKIVEAAYISGAMTHPGFRRCGYMKQLISAALKEMKRKGFSASFLIPQEEWLFDFYAKYGYRKAFPLHPEVLFVRKSETNAFCSDEQIKQYSSIEEADKDVLYPIYSRLLNRKEHAVLKSYHQFSNILKDLFMDNGMVFACENGIAFLVPDNVEENTAYLKEFLYMGELRSLFLNTIAQQLDKEKLIIFNGSSGSQSHFWGMINVLDETNLPEDIYMNTMLN